MIAASVIICTRNRPRLLEETVASILEAREAPAEIVIVDQSDEPHPAWASPVVRYIHTAGEGVSRARNIGIAEARYEALVLTDDDMRAPPGWCAALIHALESAGPQAVVTGRVIADPEDAAGNFAPSTIPDNQPVIYEGRIGGDVLYTGNMAAYRSAIHSVGGFDERLGPGTRFPAAEDNDLGFRLLEAGYRIVYAPEATIYHRAWRPASAYAHLRWSYSRGQGAFFAKYLSFRDRYMLNRLAVSAKRHLGRAAGCAFRQPRHAWAEVVYVAGLLSGAVQWLVSRQRCDPAAPAQAGRSATLASRVLRNTVSNYLGKFAWMACGFLLTPYILHHLGPGDYGIWALAASVIAYGSVLDFGISGSVVKYVAEYRARGQAAELRSVAATALWLYSGLALLAIALAIVAAPAFPHVFHMPPERAAATIRLILVMGAGLGLSLPCTVTTSVLRGLQRYDLVSLLSLTSTILYAAAVVAVLHWGGGIVELAAVGPAVTLVMQVPALSLIRRTAPELRFGWRHARLPMARTVAGFSAWLFVQDVTGRVQTKTDEVVIGASLPVAFVTPYSFARRLSEIPQVFTDQFLKVLVPLASETHAKGDFGLLQRVYLTGTRMTLAMFLPMACALGVLMRPVLQVWVGAEYAAYAPVGTILLLASLIDTSQWPAGSVLQGMGKYRALVLMSAAAACANLALSIALIRVLGLTGVALGTLIPTTVVCSALVLPYMLRTMKIGLARFVREALAPALVPCAPTLLVLLVANRFHPASLASIGAVGGLGLLVYWIVYLRVTAPTSERRLAAGLLTRPRTGLSSAG